MTHSTPKIVRDFDAAHGWWKEAPTAICKCGGVAYKTSPLDFDAPRRYRIECMRCLMWAQTESLKDSINAWAHLQGIIV